MMRRPIDDIFERMTSDHIGIVDLAHMRYQLLMHVRAIKRTHEDSPEVDKNEEAEE
jgi:hypothetical protein